MLLWFGRRERARRLHADGGPQGEDEGDAGYCSDGDPAQVASNVVEVVHGSSSAGAAISALGRAVGDAAAWPSGRVGGADARARLDVAAERGPSGSLRGVGLGRG